LKLDKPASASFCGAPSQTSLVDLGMSPLCESYVVPERLADVEPFYPLHVYACGQCRASIFTEYAYYSSYSATWKRTCTEHRQRVT
jgi:hypothetical protein